MIIAVDSGYRFISLDWEKVMIGMAIPILLRQQKVQFLPGTARMKGNHRKNILRCVSEAYAAKCSRGIIGKIPYFGGNLPIEQDEGPEDAALLEKARGLRDRYEADMEAYAFQNALADVFEVIDNANKYIDATAPWVLAKSEDSKPRLARVLYNLAETLRICTVLLQPFMTLYFL